MSKVFDFIKEAGIFYLATVDGDQPKVRPLGAVIEADDKVIFGVGTFKDVYKQLTANPCYFPEVAVPMKQKEAVKPPRPNHEFGH